MKKYMFEYEACIHTKFSVQVLAETEEEAKSKFEDKDFDVVDMTRLGTTHNFSNEMIVTETPLEGVCCLGEISEDGDGKEEKK